ncbi:MAG TPA: histidine kinase [Candidatus Brachybacterium merdavium]|uniref:histidine kinase n=1 Tax=Candidatus Brachybacterium merdavium TaxID=2838513 RepID=A0A9D2LBT6_9MICO|nr:histidine kinase [Candidatus Brachybacterium merdavium]
MPRTAATPPSPERPRIARRDVWAALGYAALVLLLASTGLTNRGLLYQLASWPLAVSIAVLLVASLGTLWRRRAPVVTLLVTGTLSLAELLLGGQITAYILLADVFFVPVLHGSRRLARTTTAIAAMLTALALLLTATLTASPENVLLVVMVASLVVLVPLMWGWEVRHHRDARRAAETLAAAEHELASARSTRAVEHERRRIAHDLHDVIAGHLSAVTLHTGLAASLEEREARDRSLSTARESARAALRDLQSMIGVLSTEDGGQLPVATLDWGSLAQRLRGRDPEAHIEVTEAATDPAQVEPSAQAALLRIASEAVTNAVRHGAAPILLVVDVTEEEVSLVLENRRAEAARPGTGLGRGAIAHRAQAVGGQAESGAIDADRWRVQARLPAHPLSPTTSKEAHA